MTKIRSFFAKGIQTVSTRTLLIVMALSIALLLGSQTGALQDIEVGVDESIVFDGVTAQLESPLYTYNGKQYIAASDLAHLLEMDWLFDSIAQQLFMGINPGLGDPGEVVPLDPTDWFARDGWVSITDAERWETYLVRGKEYSPSYSASFSRLAERSISVTYALNQQYKWFSVQLGVDDETTYTNHPPVFRIIGDDRVLYETRLRYGEPVKVAFVDVRDVDYLTFEVSSDMDSPCNRIVIINPLLQLKPESEMPSDPAQLAVAEAEAAIDALPGYITENSWQEVKDARQLVRDAVALGADENDVRNLAQLEAAEAGLELWFDTLYHRSGILELGDPGVENRSGLGWFPDPDRWNTDRTVNGQSFGDRLLYSWSHSTISDPRWIEYDISDEHFTWMEGYVGISDTDTNFSYPLTFTIYGDDVELFSAVLEYGVDAIPYLLDVREVEKLRIEWYAEETTSGGFANRIVVLEPYFYRQVKEFVSLFELGDPGPDNRSGLAWFVQYDNTDRWDTGKTINSKLFDPLKVYYAGHTNLTTPRWIEYDITDWGFERLRGWVGIWDESVNQSFPLDFEIYLDGVLAFEAHLEYMADAIPYDLDLAGVEKVKIQWSAETLSGSGYANRPAIVEPQFLRQLPDPFDPLAAAIAEAEGAIDGLPGYIMLDHWWQIRDARSLARQAFALGAADEDISNLDVLVYAESELDFWFDTLYTPTTSLELGDPGSENRYLMLGFTRPGDWNTETTINGQSFGDRPVFRISYSNISTPRWIQYDISELDFTWMEGYVGIADDTVNTIYPLTFTIYGDGEPLFSEVLEYQADAFHYLLDVSDVQMLKIEWYAEETTANDWANHIAVVEPIYYSQTAEQVSLFELGDPGEENREGLGFFVQYDNPDRWDTGIAVNGRTFDPLKAYYTGHQWLTDPRWIEYDISTWNFEKVRGWVGIWDDSVGQSFPLDFEIYLDGVLAFEAHLEYLADAIYYELDLTGVEKLKIQWSAETVSGNGWANRPAIVEPQFFRPLDVLQAAINRAVDAIAELPGYAEISDLPDIEAARQRVDSALDMGAEESQITNIDRLIYAEENIWLLLDALYDVTGILELGDPGVENRSGLGWFPDPGRWNTDRTVNGQSFGDRLLYAYSHSSISDPRWIEYDISDEGFEFMEGYVGISDTDSNLSYPLTFTIYGDGEPMFSAILEYGADAYRYLLDVSDVSILRIEWYAEETTSGGFANRIVVVEPYFYIEALETADVSLLGDPGSDNRNFASFVDYDNLDRWKEDVFIAGRSFDPLTTYNIGLNLGNLEDNTAWIEYDISTMGLEGIMGFVGICDGTASGNQHMSLKFSILGDGVVLLDELLEYGEPAKFYNLDLSEVDTLRVQWQAEVISGGGFAARIAVVRPQLLLPLSD